MAQLALQLARLGRHHVSVFSVGAMRLVPPTACLRPQPSAWLYKIERQWFTQGTESISNSQSRTFSAHSMEQDVCHDSPVLVRDFVHSALYHPKTGYFSTMPDVVGTLQQPLSLNSFSGRGDYLKAIENLYKYSGASWFTPVELFQPWYAFAIAEYILQTFDPRVPLKIYEIGGGRGTCALNILDYIKARAPSAIYDQMSYTSVEISRALAEKQMARVGEVKSHRERFHVEYRSALERHGWGSVDTSPCFVIMMEVLDNLPHDLVCKPAASSPWMEVAISGDFHGGKVGEVLRPVGDHLMRQCLDIAQTQANSSGLRNRAWTALRRVLSRFWSHPKFLWIPTGCLHLLHVLHEARPNMSLIAADFSTLPGVKVIGKGAPLVATKEDGLTVDFATYLDMKGEGDIFFPTDFSLLQKLDCTCRRGPQAESGISKIITSSKFMNAFADVSKTEAKDGYNPLLEDFSNTCFYLSMPQVQR